jgi:hypothetical protein
MNIPFTFPTVSGTVAVTDTSQAIALQGAGKTVVLKNVGNNECFVAAGAASVTATAGAGITDATDGSFSIPAGEIGSYTINTDATHLAAVCATGLSTTLRVARGEGE